MMCLGSHIPAKGTKMIAAGARVPVGKFRCVRCDVLVPVNGYGEALEHEEPARQVQKLSSSIN
jgi:hypothetical protein